jgi:hypothetical protein
MGRYKLFLGNMNFIRYLSSSLVMIRVFVTMETKLTLHGEILGVRYFFEIKCTYLDLRNKFIHL